MRFLYDNLAIALNVVHTAAEVGVEKLLLVANDGAPVQFLYDNLAIVLNVIHAAAAVHVEKLLFLGSSCIYPKFAPQPIGEDALLTEALTT